LLTTTPLLLPEPELPADKLWQPVKQNAHTTMKNKPRHVPCNR
jgi:hypothetical protein